MCFDQLVFGILFAANEYHVRGPRPPVPLVILPVSTACIRAALSGYQLCRACAGNAVPKTSPRSRIRKQQGKDRSKEEAAVNGNGARFAVKCGICSRTKNDTHRAGCKQVGFSVRFSPHYERIGHGLVRCVDPDRLGTGIVVYRFQPCLTPVSGLIEAAERGDGRNRPIGIDPADTAADAG